jgi:hypothetical protein
VPASLNLEATRQLAEFLLNQLPQIRTETLLEIRSHSAEIPSARSLSEEELFNSQADFQKLTKSMEKNQAFLVADRA